MIFQHSDLHFRDYAVSSPYADTDSRVHGDFDDTDFDRREQQEMLYFINHCYRLWGWPDYSKNPGRKIEMLLKLYIPGSVRTQIGLLKWIQEHWRHYWDHLPGK